MTDSEARRRANLLTLIADAVVQMITERDLNYEALRQNSEREHNKHTRESARLRADLDKASLAAAAHHCACCWRRTTFGGVFHDDLRPL